MELTKQVWGPFEGAIFHDFALSYPLCILSGLSDLRSEARLLAKYSVKMTGFKRRHVTGECEFGAFDCDLLPYDRAILGSLSLTGELRWEGKTIGIASVGPMESRWELGSIKSIDGKWGFSLTVIRPKEAVGEGDAEIVDLASRKIAGIKRRDFSWAEQKSSKLYFGRLKRGEFCNGAEEALASTESKIGFVFLLSCYLQLLEGAFNTDS